MLPRFSLIGLTFGLTAMLSTAVARGGEAFNIGFWCGPPSKFSTLERYRQIKEANFTVAFPPCSVMSVEENRKALDYCGQVGLRMVVMDSRMPRSIGGDERNKATLDAIVKDYGDHPALFGHFITDEPGAGAFPGLGEVVAYLKEKDPKHPGYINLLPNWAVELNVLGTKTYEEYVNQYVDVVKPFAISYDNYHFLSNGTDRAEFFPNLRTVRAISLEKKLPFWNIVLCTQHGGYRNLTEPELRFEAMQTLAFGAKGLMWFTYWLPEGMPEDEGWKHAMINPDGSRNPHYDMIKAINKDVLAIAGEIGDAVSVAVYEGTVASDSPISVSSDQFTVGVFKSAESKHLALLANRNYRTPVETTIKAGDAPMERFDPASLQWSPVNGPLTVSAGGACLIRW